MMYRTASLAFNGSSGNRPPLVACRPCGARLTAAGLVIATAILAGCAPPVEVIDLRATPQATRDAMLRIKILPLGTPGPIDAGAIGAVGGFGCGQNSVEAGTEAVEQLRIKALKMRATAVMDVVVGRADFGQCVGRSGATANGIAVGPRGIPSAY